MKDSNNQKSITLKEKIAYGLGDFGCNVVFATISAWFLPYCASCGISIKATGLILFCSKVIDAICDVLLGVYIDRFPNKIKRLMKIGLPATVVSLLGLFAVYYFPESTRLVSLFIFFNLLNSIFYNFINIPYSSLNLKITDDIHEREWLNCFRMAGSITCMCVINAIYPMFPNKIIMYSIFSIVMVLCVCATIFGTKERVEIVKEENQKIDISYFKAVFGNSFFWIAIALFVVINGKLATTMMKIGLDNEMAAIKTLLFMVPSIIMMFILPRIYSLKENIKYKILYVCILICLIISVIGVFIKLPVFVYLIDGFAFSSLASMIYNVFADVNTEIKEKTEKDISGIMFALTALLSNFSVGFIGLLYSVGFSVSIITVLFLCLGLVVSGLNIFRKVEY